MLDFLMISTRSKKGGHIEIYPRFRLDVHSDLMIRGGDFYAVWDEDRQLWSTDEEDAIRLIDNQLDIYAKENAGKFDGVVKVSHLWDSETGQIDKWHKYCQKQMRDRYHMLDEKLIFSNTETTKKDYSSKKLNYPLEPGECPAWEKLISTLYSPTERHKIEWAIGSIVSGESKRIQKFLVLYGSAGTGKSTILNIIQQLFDGYYSVFDAKALGSASNSFALEAFKSNPLVAIQHDGDLSRIEDNTRLNSLVSHERMTVNEKFKSTYTNAFKAFLFMGTNKPVKITDAKSGLLRRLIDVTPSGNKVPVDEYRKLIKQVNFELGAIASRCLEVFNDNPGEYDDYVPVSMMGASNDFYNYILECYETFKEQDGVSLKQAWELYKNYVEDAKISYPYSQRVFKEELKNYFEDFEERARVDDDERVRNYYSGFKFDIFEAYNRGRKKKKPELEPKTLVLDKTESIVDKMLADCPAQLASEKGTPVLKWTNCKSKLKDISSNELHYVQPPENHIVIDFDIPGKDGEKSYEKNLLEASKWPPTYAELSKSGKGVHLHYIYSGDAKNLSRVYDDHIEIKVFTGNSSLRRKLSRCNDLPVATISSGLPLKGEIKKMINTESVKSEKGLRTLIKRNLAKEIHPGTKPSIDFIKKILDDAYESDLKYDVTDMQNVIYSFAMHSTNQADYCCKMVDQMKFRSEEQSQAEQSKDDTLIFYDIEVFPNLFLVNWKKAGEGNPVVRMINPSPTEMEELMRFNLVGFNCRKYDNHLIYARMLGHTNEQLYKRSVGIIKNDKDMFFREAYNVSYTDVYDFAAKKQGLKKWEIELGIHHQELGLPWDQPVPEEKWEQVAAYCDNDVIATEAVFNHLKGDFTARKILAELAGGTVNDTTNSLTTKIIFGNEKHPNLVYTDLSKEFPGYEYIPAYEAEDKKAHNMYRGVDLGFGGYVYAEPGMYGNIALLDVASLHPHSIIAMNCFGDYTERFHDILNARMYIKHKDFDKARSMLGGKLAPYLDDEGVAKDLAQALKIAINSVYGLTSASFDNPFRDKRNVNNIVALRGALFMKTLQDEVVKKGFKVAHIKTDSIKIPDATPEIIDFCMEFAKGYGYTFEHEATYDKICLVNNAVYIAKDKSDGHWTATGAQFQVPYVFKTLFSKEDILFEDMCETFSVKEGDLYLDMNEGITQPIADFNKELKKIEKDFKNELITESQKETLEKELTETEAKGHKYVFVGRVGQFCPIKPGCGGGVLYRMKDGKYYAAAGSTGYRFLESEVVKELGKEADIDRVFYDTLVNDAVDAINKFGDFEWFASDEPYDKMMEFMKTVEDSPEELPFV